MPGRGAMARQQWKHKCVGAFTDGNTVACVNDHGSVQQWDTNGEMIRGVWATVEDAVALLSWSPVEATLPVGLSMEQFSFENQIMEKSR